MESNTAVNNNPQKTELPNKPKNPSSAKLIIFLLIGLSIGLAVAAAVYFLILKDRDQEKTDDQIDPQTSETATQAVDPASYKYDTFLDPQKHFSFKYPTNIIRINPEDIDKTIPKEVKDKYKTQVLFVGVLQDGQSVVQIMAESFEFDPNKTLSETYKELLQWNQENGVSTEITKEQTGNNELAIEADILIDQLPYKSLERIVVLPQANGVVPAYAISVVISEPIFDKYVNVGKYIVESAIVGDSLEVENENVNPDMVKDIYLGRFPRGSNAPTNGEGIIATTTFNKSDDLICLVTDLEETTSGFSIEVFDKSNNNLVTSDYNTTFEKGISSGCNQISFGPGEFTFKISRNSETIKEIDFTVE